MKFNIGDIASDSGDFDDDYIYMITDECNGSYCILWLFSLGVSWFHHSDFKNDKVLVKYEPDYKN